MAKCDVKQTSSHHPKPQRRPAFALKRQRAGAGAFLGWPFALQAGGGLIPPPSIAC